jgi:hypothetical protein
MVLIFAPTHFIPKVNYDGKKVDKTAEVAGVQSFE